MYWPKFNEQTLYKRIRASKKKSSGVNCSYIQYTKYVGLKMFFDRHSMKQSMRGQQRAAKHGIAPKVGKSITLDLISFSRETDSYGFKNDAPIPKRIKLYCFFTQTATKIGKRVSHKKICGLYEKLEEIGINHDDLHQWNMGYVGKRLVCIDYDDASCSLENL